MIGGSEDIGKPDDREHRAQRAHKPEAASPSRHVNEPAKNGRKDGQCEILRGVEDGGGASALRRWEPRRDNASVAGKHRRLRQSRQQAQQEDGCENQAGAQVSGPAGEQCERRPQNDADAIDALRSKAVQQSSGRQLSQRVRPSKAEQQIPEPLRGQVHALGHEGRRLRQRRAVRVAEAAYGEQDGDDQIANAGCLLRLGQAKCLS